MSTARSRRRPPRLVPSVVPRSCPRSLPPSSAVVPAAAVVRRSRRRRRCCAAGGLRRCRRRSRAVVVVVAARCDHQCRDERHGHRLPPVLSSHCIPPGFGLVGVRPRTGVDVNSTGGWRRAPPTASSSSICCPVSRSTSASHDGLGMTCTIRARSLRMPAMNPPGSRNTSSSRPRPKNTPEMASPPWPVLQPVEQRPGDLLQPGRHARLVERPLADEVGHEHVDERPGDGARDRARAAGDEADDEEDGQREPELDVRGERPVHHQHRPGHAAVRGADAEGHRSCRSAG